MSGRNMNATWRAVLGNRDQGGPDNEKAVRCGALQCARVCFSERPGSLKYTCRQAARRHRHSQAPSRLCLAVCAFVNAQNRLQRMVVGRRYVALDSSAFTRNRAKT